MSSLKYVDDDRKKAIAMQWAQKEDEIHKRYRQKLRRRGYVYAPQGYSEVGVNEDVRRQGYRFDADHRMWKLQHPHKRWNVLDYAPRRIKDRHIGRSGDDCG